ncbi:MAG: TlpA family protein disulfide reductase [Sulfurovaceae bacterium]|nr:TlpA family protein disulfide reductase [Sulfurovaceae bacterium]
MRKIIFTILMTMMTTLYADTATRPHFIITDTTNSTINITDLKQGLLFDEYKGKAVLLLMFGHNCPPCKKEIPELIELFKNNKDRLAIVAVEVQGYKTAQLSQFKTLKGINYTLISGEDNQKFVQHIFQRSGWQGQIPFLIAIDKNGEVKDIRAGLLGKKTLEGFVDSLNR